MTCALPDSRPDPDAQAQGIVSSDLLAVLRAAEPADFVRVVRAEKQAGRYDDLLRAAGVRVDGNAGTSATRKLGNLCAALHAERRNEYMAAFFDSSNTKISNSDPSK